MKKLLKTTALSLALASSAAIAAENIAFINVASVYQNHPEQQVIAQKLNQQFKGEADKLREAKKKIETQLANLDRDAKKLRSTEVKKRRDELNKLVQQHDEKAAKFQQKLQEAENKETLKILESIQGAINNLARQKGYTYVIDANSVIFTSEGKDITQEVLKRVSTKSK